MPANKLAQLEETASSSPTLPLMHAAFVLAGLGTMLLGPILPLLSARWSLNDAQSGLLLLSQFCGATLGGVTVSSRLNRGLLIGLLAGAVGFFSFGLAPTLPFACAGLLVGGFGVGRMIAAINFIAGARYTQHRGSALSWLNLSWSLGALLSPLSAAWLASRFQLSFLLIGFAGLFLLIAGVFAWQVRRNAAQHAEASAAEQPDGLGSKLFVYFAVLLLLYGGVETCLSGWLTTFALRHGRSSLLLSQYTMVLLLCGLTAGRALAGWLLVRIQEARLQRAALVLTGVTALTLALSSKPLEIASLAVVLGVVLAPVFPATFAIVMARRPSARQAGMVLAASGAGAAAFPWLMGVVSNQTGSLQIALAVPIATIFILLLFTFGPSRMELRT